MVVVSMTVNGIDHSDTVHGVSKCKSTVSSSNLTVSNPASLFKNLILVP